MDHVHCIQLVTFTEDVQGLTGDEMTWHCIQITFSQVKTEVSSQNLWAAKLYIPLFELIWAIIMSTEPN